MEKELNREIIMDGKIMLVTKEEVELENGMHKPIKLLTLTASGLIFDPDAEEAPVTDAE